MKHYKTIIIDGKKLGKRLAGISLLAVFLLLLLQRTELSSSSILSHVLPSVSVANGAYAERLSAWKSGLSKLLSGILTFDPTTPETILSAELPAFAQINNSPLLTSAHPLPEEPLQPMTTPAPVLPENQAPIKAVDLSPDKSKSGTIVLGNQTSYGVDIESMLNTPVNLDLSMNGPKVLIIHTHATESYTPEGIQFYDIQAGDRSQNTEENVVRVGKTMADVLTRRGIAVIHDTQLHDYPSFNGSYAHSLSAIESYLKEYPSIQMVLDLHRDSIVYDDNTKAKPVTQINGTPAAQLMFVVGTDEKGLYHPHWRDNLRCAIHLQHIINQKYPTLMRHINLRQERFNGHTTKASLIIETGSSGNTLSEAEYAISLAGECIADFLIGKK